jgi:hypothetical protein
LVVGWQVVAPNGLSLLKKYFVEPSLSEKVGKALLYKADSRYIGDNRQYFVFDKTHHFEFFNRLGLLAAIPSQAGTDV